MKTDMLDGLGDVDLRAVAARCEELLALHDRQRKDKALEDARAILAEAGLSLRDVASGKPQKNGSKGPVYHAGRQYQHPTNKTLTWNARGQKPKWLRELEDSGGKALEEWGMREPDAWWEHVPVVSKYKSIFPEHADWHLRQLITAINKTSKTHPGALKAIPERGFHVRALRTIDKRDDGRYAHLLAVGICEDVEDTLEDFDLVIVAKANNTLRKGSVVKHSKAFGSRTNAFLPIFEELIARVPEGWQTYMERKALELPAKSANDNFPPSMKKTG